MSDGAADGSLNILHYLGRKISCSIRIWWINPLWSSAAGDFVLASHPSYPMGIHSNCCLRLWLNAHEKSALVPQTSLCAEGFYLKTTCSGLPNVWCRRESAEEVKWAAWWHRSHLILKGRYRASEEMFWATGESGRTLIHKITWRSIPVWVIWYTTHSSHYWAKSLLNSVCRTLEMYIVFILQRGKCPFLAQRTLQCHLMNWQQRQVSLQLCLM